MKVIDHINTASSTLFSIEILPPLKGENIENIFETLNTLNEFNPSFVNVTYHREEFVYKDVGNGLLEKRTVRKRPGTVGICAAIKNKFNIDPVPHIICGGFSKYDTEDALIDLNFLEIDNVLLLRGDPIKSERSFMPENNGYAHTTDLVTQVVNMNNGIYLDDELENANKTEFCIGVAGYPEKHYESPSMKTDLKWLKEKVIRGAQYIVTQMFFDNNKYYAFVDACRKEGINIPIIPGLKPLTSRTQLNLLPQNFHIDFPDELIEIIENTPDKNIANVGIEWCIHQSKELIKYGVPVLHYYTMGKGKSVSKVAKAVF